MVVSRLRQVGDEIGGPAASRGRRSQAATKPSRPCSASTRVDRGLIGLGGRRAEGERDLAEAELEQAIAAPRLAVIVALRRGAGEDLDLAIVESEAPIDRGDLRLDRALVRQEEPRRAALDDGGRDGAAVDVGERLGGEDDGGVLLAQRLQPLAQLRGKAVDRRAQASPRRRSAGSAGHRGGLRCDGRDRRARRARRRCRSAPRSRRPAPRPRRDARSRRRAAGRRGRRGNRVAAPASALADCSSTERPVSVRSSTGAVASEVSADQRCSFTSGVTVTPSRARMSAIHSAAQARSGV